MLSEQELASTCSCLRTVARVWTCTCTRNAVMHVRARDVTLSSACFKSHLKHFDTLVRVESSAKVCLCVK